MRIIYAEDSIDFQEVMRSLLEKHGHAVEIVENGGQLVKRLNENANAAAAGSEERFDLAITDYDMPVMNGLEALDHIRDDVRFEHFPVVVFTTRETRALACIEKCHGLYLPKSRPLPDLEVALVGLLQYLQFLKE